MCVLPLPLSYFENQHRPDLEAHERTPRHLPGHEDIEDHPNLKGPSAGPSRSSLLPSFDLTYLAEVNVKERMTKGSGIS